VGHVSSAEFRAPAASPTIRDFFALTQTRNRVFSRDLHMLMFTASCELDFSVFHCRRSKGLRAWAKLSSHTGL